MDLFEAINNYELICLAEKVYGPFIGSNKRQFVIIIDEDGNRKTVSYPKYLLEKNLNRKLDPDLETVHHLDGNYFNNDISNLEIVPRDQHSADDTRRVKLIKLKCVLCDKEFERSPRLLRDKSKKGNSGPFCSRQCAGRYSRRLQLKLIDKMYSQPYIESEYYRRKNVESTAINFIKKYAGYMYKLI